MEEPKPKINRIHIPKDKVEYLKKVIDNSVGTESKTSEIIRKNIGGGLYYLSWNPNDESNISNERNNKNRMVL